MIAIGCDHAAVALKKSIIEFLTNKGYQVKDFGAHEGEAVDYPDKGLEVAECVASGEAEFGIVICGTGIGISISANKVKGIRCALCSDTFSAKATREHNNANMLAFGERVIGTGLALEIVDAFVSTPFSNAERHVRRINKITAIEEKYFK